MKRPTKQSQSRLPSELHHRPSKRFGQNFLTDKRVIARIINHLDPSENETIIEIGPGTGALTGELVNRAGRLIVVEFDRKLAPLLRDRFATRENFELMEGDALITDFCSVIQPASQARLVANLPYNISTAMLRKLIAQRACLSEMVLMLQKEVVERISAPAGSSERGYLSVLVEAYCELEKLFDVNPASFRPTPKVWSTVIRVTSRPKIAVALRNEELLWAVVSAGFAQRRKTILNNLRSAPEALQEVLKHNGGASIVLCRAGVDLQRRAETILLTEWAAIAEALE